jgi:mono/diheme cytochrome c family protein
MRNQVELHRVVPAILTVVLAGTLGVVVLPARVAVGQADKSNRKAAALVVTPVEGTSWIHHLGIADVRNTALGQMGGNEPASTSKRQEPKLTTPEQKGPLSRAVDRIFSLFRSESDETAKLMDETFVLTGSDLYRLNCQSCHGPGGVGSPPEIKSLLGPVEGTSPALIQERMRKLGREVNAKLAGELAAGAESSIRERLQQGGEKMPPFRHLRGDEVEALLVYVKDLAGVPVSERKEQFVPQSVARVGEHVVKGTCHICHDATGPGGGHMAMMQGVIPSLASFPEQNSMQEIVRQVRMGSSRMMGMMGGPTMPAFPYITEEEAAAAYLYLVKYPPRQ